MTRNLMKFVADETAAKRLTAPQSKELLELSIRIDQQGRGLHRANIAQALSAPAADVFAHEICRLATGQAADL
jgi:hypothetical protein